MCALFTNKVGEGVLLFTWKGVRKGREWNLSPSSAALHCFYKFSSSHTVISEANWAGRKLLNATGHKKVKQREALSYLPHKHFHVKSSFPHTLTSCFIHKWSRDVDQLTMPAPTHQLRPLDLLLKLKNHCADMALGRNALLQSCLDFGSFGWNWSANR